MIRCINPRDSILILNKQRALGFATYGNPKGKPLFFFHGWPSSRLAGAITDMPAKHLGIRVIAVDRPGYGLSTYIPDRTLFDWPDDVCRIADALNIHTFAILGVSGGGPYAVVSAYKIPKRLTKIGIVAGLAPPYIPGLLDGTSLLTQLSWKCYVTIPGCITTGCLLHYLNTKYGPSLGLHRYFFGSKKDRTLFMNAILRNEIKNSTKEAFRAGYAGVLKDLYLYTHPWNFDITKIRKKVHLWYGADDKNVSITMGRYYAKQIPHNSFTEYNGEGHLISRTHIEKILSSLMR